jgi:predicted  nucleic acid-binding Zn-ribbon protein
MEHYKRKCKVCGQEKDRILLGKFPNGKDKKWTQIDDKLWNGNTCGDCNVKISAEKMRKIRNKDV